MNRKLQRVIRDRPLTTAEIAHDEEVRRAVQTEFPPANTRHESRSDSIGEALRTAVRDSTQPAAEIAAKADLSPLA